MNNVSKTVTFTIMHFSIAFLVAYLLSGSLILGGLIALVEPAVNSVGYYFHEKIWDKAQSERSSGTNSAPKESTV